MGVGAPGSSSGGTRAGSMSAALIEQLFAPAASTLTSDASGSGSGWASKSQVQDAYDWYSDTASKAA